jgi:aminoglycoside phosphotransferase family enzyme/predicted kinase
VPAPLAATLPERLAASLPAPVALRETHAAWVLLSGEVALKVRKPVRYAFLDYSTRERRFEAAVEELRVNDALASGLYRGVRALVERDGALVVGPYGTTPDAVDYALEMRRFDERRTMAALCEDARLTGDQVDAVAALLARFHASAERCEGGAAAFAARVRADLSELASLAGPVPALARFAEGALARHARELDERAAAGLWRDGHGYLRAEHVVFQQPPLVVDRIEFDAELRRTDVASDLAFLAMDLEALGCAWAAERLVTAYAGAGGDPGDAGLRAFFAWQRALVRAKVALLRGDEQHAAGLLALAERLAWRERLAGIVLVTGPPASGKSTLAGELARRSGLPLLPSDPTRKALFGAAATARLPPEAYAEDVTRAVYKVLAYRAALASARHGGAIVDATGRSPELRRAFLDHLGDAGPVLALVCDAPAELRRERAQARLADPQRVSDADPQIAERLAARFEAAALGEPGIDRVLAADCGLPLATTVDQLAAAHDEAPGAPA